MDWKLCVNHSCSCANADATGADSATFKITDAKLYVPTVTLSAKENEKLSKL